MPDIFGTEEGVWNFLPIPRNNWQRDRDDYLKGHTGTKLKRRISWPDPLQHRRGQIDVEGFTIRTHMSLIQVVYYISLESLNSSWSRVITHLKNRYMLLQSIEPLYGDVRRREEEMGSCNEQ